MQFTAPEKGRTEKTLSCRLGTTRGMDKSYDEDGVGNPVQRETVGGVNRKQAPKAYHFRAGGANGEISVVLHENCSVSAEGLLDPVSGHFIEMAI